MQIRDSGGGGAIRMGASAGGQDESDARFRVSMCKRPLPEELHRAHGVPLPANMVQVLHEALPWEALAVRMSSHSSSFIPACRRMASGPSFDALAVYNTEPAAER